MSGGALDRLLPEYQFVERHHALVHASRHEVWRALHEVMPSEMALTRILFGLRTLPARLAGARRAAPPGPWLPALIASGFKVMAETPEHELVLGTSGRFWELRARPRPQSDPGGAVAAMDFRLEDRQGRILLTTETRVAVEDRAARRRFAVYWAVIRIGSALIRRDLLRAVRRRAERSSPGTEA
jgi:hypothetical protein